jgi:hypothetical protein
MKILSIPRRKYVFLFRKTQLQRVGIEWEESQVLEKSS